MSDAQTGHDNAAMPDPTRPPQPAGGAAAGMMSELKVSGHLMSLEVGLYCVTHAPIAGGQPSNGLPGVRISTPPAPLGRPEQVVIASFRPDGYLHATGDAALVRSTPRPGSMSASQNDFGDVLVARIFNDFEGNIITRQDRSRCPQ